MLLQLEQKGRSGLASSRRLLKLRECPGGRLEIPNAALRRVIPSYLKKLLSKLCMNQSAIPELKLRSLSEPKGQISQINVPPLHVLFKIIQGMNF